MSKGRVLVIDDDEWVCRLLAVAMKEAGFEVTLTDTAADGFFRAVEEQPHCIVCDVDLPDQDGYWVARRIRQHPSRVSMAPFVFLSGLDDREHRLEGFSVGGDAYLTKPFRIDEVVAQVDALVQMAERLKKSRATLHSIPPSGPAMVGNLAQMNVATILTMLDLERRSGKLELSNGKLKADFFLVTGSIASATVDDNPTAPLAAIRTVTSWTKGKFAFSPTEAPDNAGAGTAEPINALLMEAARLQDESHQEEGLGTASDRLSSAWKESLRIPRAQTPPPPAASSAPESSDIPMSFGPGSTSVPAQLEATTKPVGAPTAATPPPALTSPPAASPAPPAAAPSEPSAVPKGRPGFRPPPPTAAGGLRPSPGPAGETKDASRLGTPPAAPRLPTGAGGAIASPRPSATIPKTGFGGPLRSHSPSKPMPAVKPPAPPVAPPKAPLAKPSAPSPTLPAAADTPDEGWGEADTDASDETGRASEATSDATARATGTATPPKPPRAG
jgi:DNA-binding response OmpR family regulator